MKTGVRGKGAGKRKTGPRDEGLEPRSATADSSAALRNDNKKAVRNENKGAVLRGGSKQAVTRNDSKDVGGYEAAARVIAAGGRVPKKFAKARPVSAGPTLGMADALAKVTPARRVAFEILARVGEGRGHSDELLHGPATDNLSEADRNLATALVMGVLRWEIALDAQIRKYLERPDQRLAEEVSIALRMGAFQLLHMDRIPAHAALSESVELCRAAGQPHATGMVNAILRKVATAKKLGAKVFETTAAFAERLGHPAWLVKRWVKHYGREAAMKICEAGQTEPDGGGLFLREEGLPQVDDGSRLVAEIAAAAAPRVEGVRVWDCCAAPGGKTLVLAKRLAESRPGAEVLATDVSARRMGQMEARLRRYQYAGAIKCEVADAMKLPREAGEFDLVLCDVPCSGTGTLARNPEIRARLRVEDLARQATRQREILVAAVVGDGWKRVPVEELGVAGVSAGMVRDGELRTLPGVDACDGFYAVVVERQ